MNVTDRADCAAHPAPGLTDDTTGNVVDRLARWARAAPDRPAMVTPGGVMTFAELDRRTRIAALRFARCGLRAGDRLWLAERPGPDFFARWLGAMRLGAAVVLVDPRAGWRAMRWALQSAAPTAVAGGPGVVALGAVFAGASIRRRITTRGWYTTDARSRDDAVDAPPAFDPPSGHPALITFTSGSTGRPKGLVRSHAFLLAQRAALAATLPPVPGATQLTFFPVFALANLADGVTTRLPVGVTRPDGSVDGPALAEVVMREAVDQLLAPPAALEALLAALAPGQRLAGLSRVVTGGSPVFPALLRRLAEAAPNARIYALYGSTEAEPIACLDARDLGDDDLARVRVGEGLPAGRVADSVALRIVDDRWGAPLPSMTPDAFDAATLPPGKVGEIVVAGPNVQRGYLDPRADAATKIRVASAPGEGATIWHRTGDAGRLDADGRLWLLGRCAGKFVPVPGEGRTLYPLSVEGAAKALWPSPEARVAWAGRIRPPELAVEGFDPDAESVARLAETFPEMGAVKRVAALPMDARRHGKIHYEELPDSPFPAWRARPATLAARLWQYQRERFPVAQYIPLLGAFALGAAGVSALLRDGGGTPSAGAFAAAFIGLFGLMFQLRVSDEFKDFTTDRVHQPERAVPRGLVTRKTLFGAGAVWALSMAVAAWALYPPLLGLLAAAWAYLGLMSAEFFVPAALRRRPFLYMATHMMILPLADLFATACDWMPAGAGPPPGLMPFLAVSYFNGVIIEIGRKTWPASRERPGVESYSAYWGARRAMAVWGGAAALSAACSMAVAARTGFVALTAAGTAAMLATAGFVAWRAGLRTSEADCRRLENFSGVWVIANYLLLGVIPLGVRWWTTSVS